MNRARLTLIATFVLLGLATALAPTASAYWSTTGGGFGSALVDTMPVANQPTTSVTVPAVTVSFAQNTVGGQFIGAIGGEYEIRRYPASGGAAVTPNGACGSPVSGPGATLSCVETPTPPGEWIYTVEPILHGWSGTEGTASAMTTVAPEVPANFAATSAPAGAITLDWDFSPGATGYNIYRSTTSGGYNFTAPLNGGTPVSGPSYNDSTAVSGTTYYYVVRALVIGGSSQQIESASSVEDSALSDATVPTAVTITNPGTPLRGLINLSGSASDTISGVSTITFEYKLSSGSTWATACVDTATPFACSFDSTTTADGLYDFRAVASDFAGNTAASTPVTSIQIDNTAPTALLTDPGAYLRATVTLTGSSSDAGSGVVATTIERRLVGGGAWTTTCSSVTTAVSCAFNTTTVVDGDYELRTSSTDAAGNIGYSTVLTPIRIDNTRPTAADIQTINAGVLGRPEAGDQVVYTFSEVMQPAMILAGFTGASMNVTVRINNAGNNDRLFVYDAANTTRANLGQVRLGRNYVTGNRTFTGSTMVMTGSVLTVTLGTASGTVNTVTTNATLNWRPVTTPLDLAGNQMMNTARNETGAADPNF